MTTQPMGGGAMTEQINGGAAFPQITELVDIATTSGGMTMREYVALHVTAPDDMSMGYAEALAGRKHPHAATALSAAETREVVRFWADAEMAWRFIYADAFIAAREASHDL